MSRSNDEGFVLIGVIWLMVLAGAIVALLMLRARLEAEAARDVVKQAQAHLSEQAAAETVAADLIFAGQRSQWATVPVTRDVDIDGQMVTVTMSSEESRIDINSASLERIDAALQAAGVGTRGRAQLGQRLTVLRNTKATVDSEKAFVALLSRGGIENDEVACLSSRLTVFSGLAEPSGAAITLAPGQMFRLEAHVPENAGIRIIGRSVGLRGEGSSTYSYSAGAANPEAQCR